MIACPNCGYKHAPDDYASELAELKAPPIQHRLVLRMMQARGALVTNEQLIDCLYGDRPDGGPETAANTIQSHACRARKKIAKFGWALECERFRGYRLVRIAA